ncbi:MAG: T9SS type A sorting domain-containing protein [Bacteroidota bacterium]
MHKILLMLIALVICFTNVETVNAQETVSYPELDVQVTHAQFLGTTPPLRDLIRVPLTDREKKEAFERNRKEIDNFYFRDIRPEPNPHALPKGADPVWQAGLEKDDEVDVFPVVNVNGLMAAEVGNASPPDPSGDVGKDFYLQAVNATWMQVFDKTGAPVGNAFQANTIWSQVGFSSAGDPIILFDQEAERWIMTEFPPGNQLLFAISATSDPLGSWMAWNFGTPNFPDYPKYSMWPNAYVVTTNEQGPSVLPNYFIDRQAILNGDANPTIQRITMPGVGSGPGFQVSTPVDWSGADLPPADALPPIIRLNDDAWGQVADDQIEIFEYDVDFNDINNTTSTSTVVLTSAFDTNPCSVPGPGFSCIPQPNGSGIDGLPEVIMHQAHYRNFGTHESIVLNFITDATGTDVSGIRWMEIRRSGGGSWTLYQEGTFAPNDGQHRFMGAIAQDGFGNIGLAYSISSDTRFPSLAFTGRRASDPLGMMTINEFIAVDGTGNAPNSRYGDYAQMAVDPSDDKTFWFTGEYYTNNGFGTRIIAFQLGRDTTDIGPSALIAPVDDSELSDAETVTVEVENFGLDTIIGFDVGYIFEGGTAEVETVSGIMLFPEQTYTHTFTNTVNMSALGTYDFKIFTSLSDDTNVLNDTLRQFVENIPRWDVGITGSSGLTEPSPCGPSVDAFVTLTNFGTETITTVTINVLLNGGNFQSIPWTGNLPGGESVQVPITLMNLINGSNALSATTVNPNGETDQNITNNAHVRPFLATIDGVPLVLELTTDLFPQETSWTLEDDEGNTISSGGPYPGEATSTILEYLCVDPELCFVFTLFDSFGDGIEAYGVSGDYQFVDGDGIVLASLIDPDFGDEEVNEFCFEMGCAITANVNPSNPSGGQSNDGLILVTATSGMSPFMYSIDGGSTFQPLGFFGGLGVGTYNVVVQDANGCSYIEEVELSISTSLENIIPGGSIEIYPNPTDGIFHAEVHGLDHNEVFLKFDIIDAAGRVVHRSTLTRYDNSFVGDVGLLAFPSGVYMMRLHHPAVTGLIRVVKN